MRKTVPWLLLAAFTFAFGVVTTILVGGILLHAQPVSAASSFMEQMISPSHSASPVSLQVQSTPPATAATPASPGAGPFGGRMPGFGQTGPGWGMGPGMGPGPGPQPGFGAQTPLLPSASRISIDQAVGAARQYVSGYYGNADLVVSHAMEFSNNFYIIVREASTGRGAFELLVDPVSGGVYPEYGPNMMWNFKYGMMGGWMGGRRGSDNTLTLDQAVAQAQKYLDSSLSGARVETDGMDFYGYYTFDYTVNGQIAGMLSINGFSGQIWVHTWHGQFIAEKDLP